ncbi:MAG: hypothetical protein ACE5LV_03855 [Candidatus Aminicenantales bacterium]
MSLLLGLVVLGGRGYVVGGAGAEGCGECPNPLVELKNLEAGEISEDVLDMLADMVKEYGGFGSGVPVFDVLGRGFEFLEFKKRNPCAAMYYVENRYTGKGISGYEKIRHGVQEGKAKYIIRSTVDISKAEAGEQARVRHEIYDANGNVKSSKLGSVGKIGSVHMHHELVCLKNNETYDVGDANLDWIPDPPENEFYGLPDSGTDGLIFGGFTKGDLASSAITLNRGDVGKTIRKKETPSAFSLDVEEEPLYPPYYVLKIHSIRNLFGEALPNKIFVAIRARHGKIEGGKTVQGWSVFPTENAEISTRVLYKVPECARTTKDILEIAAYCDWHAGEAMVGKPRSSQNIPIPKCFSLSLTLSNMEYMWSESESTLQLGSVYQHEKELTESRSEISAFVTFNKKPERIQPLSGDTFLYVYKIDSWHVGNQNIFLRKNEDRREQASGRTAFESHYYFYKQGTVNRLEPLSQELVFVYDKRRDKIIKVEEMPAFDPVVNVYEKIESSSYTPETGWKREDKMDQYEEVGIFIGRSMEEEETISGDGRTSLVGYTRKEDITPVTQENRFTTVSGRTIEMMRWELRRK